MKYLLLIYMSGVIVSEAPYATKQECIQAKHNQPYKAACVRNHTPDPRRVPVPVEEVKVGASW